jgi:multidrug efflux pump subunit AcrA (membrane-fusion protein)
MNRNFPANHIRVGTPSPLGQQHSFCHSERSLRREESILSWVSANFAVANIFVAALLLILALSYASCGVSRVGASDGDVPSGSAQKGDVQLRFPTDGLLKAAQSRAVTVPAVAGGTLRIIRLAHTGSSVKKGDIVLEFDPSQQEYLMAQNRSDLAQAEQKS